MRFVAKARNSANSIRRLIRAGVLALMATLLVASPGAAQTDIASPLRPKSLKLYPDTQQGIAAKPLEGNEFVETQQRLVFAVEFDKSIAGTMMDVAIVNVRSTGGLEQAIFTASDKIGADGRLPIELRLPRDWPVGHYAVRLGVNERLIASLPFRIRAAAPRHTPIRASSEIRIVQVSDDGKDLLLVPQPTSKMRNLSFLLDTTGAETDGASITWTLTALASAVGNNVVIGSNTTDDWPLENTRLTFDVELPREWPPGKYRVEAKIGSQVLSALQFDVVP